MASGSNQSDQNPLSRILSSVGLSSDFAQRVRFRGPVGKLALIGVACFAVLLAVGAKSSSATVQGMCAIMAVIVALALGGAILRYSDKHPDQATLEGMEVVIFHQQKAWAAKGWTGEPPIGPVIPDPAGAPPQISPPEDMDR